MSMKKSKKGSSKTKANQDKNSCNNNDVSCSNTISNTSNNECCNNMIWVDPIYIRFQHARIRPKFSSCGRTLMETLISIRNHDISPLDLPPIQVLVGPLTDDGQHRWYFSLNNRRLWIFKRCRDEGLLSDTNNQILVRVRPPKSHNEMERYKLDNCAVEAKVIREPINRNKNGMGKNQNVQRVQDTDERRKGLHVNTNDDIIPTTKNATDDEDGNHDEDEDQDDTSCSCSSGSASASDAINSRSNRFSALN